MRGRVGALLVVAGTLTVVTGCERSRVDRASRSASQQTTPRPDSARDSVVVPVDTTPTYVGFLRKDGLLVNTFHYRLGAWELLGDSASVPADWTVYTYDHTRYPLQVGAVEEIRDVEITLEAEYHYSGRRTDYPPDTASAPWERGRDIGIAATAPTRPYLVYPLDSGSAVWTEVARASSAAFEALEQRAIMDALERSLCARMRPGADCNPTAERARILAEGRLPAGYPLDSLERARGEVIEFSIEGTNRLPSGFALYQVVVRRRYSGTLRTTDSRFTANVLRRNDQLAIIDTTIALGGDPEGRDLSGLAVHAVLLRGGRVYIVGERWALEESSPVVLEVADTGFVSAVSRRE